MVDFVAQCEITAKGEHVLFEAAKAKFTEIFGRKAAAGASAPGRVNLIGEHVDYCDGFVLPVGEEENNTFISRHTLDIFLENDISRVGAITTPNVISIRIYSLSGYLEISVMFLSEVSGRVLEQSVNLEALPFTTIVVGAYNELEVCRIHSILTNGDEMKTSFLAPCSGVLKPGEPVWANYVKGVLANFPVAVRGFDAVIVSDVPMGAGVSSSASLEVAIFTFLESLTGQRVGLVEKAQLCQKAEHEFPGMPCGIMDQYIVTMGKRDHALLIDCRSLEAKQIPLELGDAVILVVNSNIKHQLTGSEYPSRRAQCQEAAKILKMASLRDAHIKHVEDLKRLNADTDVVKRAKHVIEEIARTETTAALLAQKDLSEVGALLYQSHESLSQLMEVSCPEVDQLVEILRSSPGVYGARMTGGGFGGCVIALAEGKSIEDIKKRVLAEYKSSPTFFICKPSDGAKVLQI